jgi:hypothetical protein
LIRHGPGFPLRQKILNPDPHLARMMGCGSAFKKMMDPDPHLVKMIDPDLHI